MMKKFIETNQCSGAKAGPECKVPRLTLRRGHIHSAWRARANCSVLATVMIFLFAAALKAQQPQIPTAAGVYAGGPLYDYCPVTNSKTWGTPNQGSPVINAVEGTDTRKGIDGLNDNNSQSVTADMWGNTSEEFLFTVSLDAPGNIAFANPSTNASATEYVLGYQGITLRQINPLNGAIANTWRLDSHVGVCGLPRIVKDDAGNLYIFWRERTPNGGGTHDQVMGCHFSTASGSFDVTATSVGGAYYTDIREMQVTTESESSLHNDHGAAVIIRDHVNGSNDRIFAQRVTVNAGVGFNLLWQDACNPGTFSMRQVAGYMGAGSCNPYYQTSFSPVIAYDTVKDRYDLAWADQSTGAIYVESLDFYAIPGGYYHPAGQATGSLIDITTQYPSDPTTGKYCEFYEQPLKGYTVGGVDQGAVAFYYRNQPLFPITSPQVELDSYVLNGGATTTPFYSHTNGTGLAADCNPGPDTVITNSPNNCFPCALTKRTVSGTVESAVGICVEDSQTLYVTTACPPPPEDVHVQHIVYMDEWNANTLVFKHVSSRTNVMSQRFESYIGFNSYGAIAVVPDVGGGEIYGLGFGGGSITYKTDCDARSVASDGNGINSTGQWDGYYSCALGQDSIEFVTYDYGVNRNTKVYPTTDLRFEWFNLFDSVDYNHETDEPNRETFFQPNEYNYSCYPYSYSVAQVTAAPVEDNTLEFNPHTSVYHTYAATAYEKVDGVFNSNLFLGATNNNLTSGTTYQLTNVTDGSEVFYQPVVAIGSYPGVSPCSSTDTFAVVTYIKMIQSPSFSQKYCYKVVDLTTGTIGAENVIETAPSGEYAPYFRNWDAVYDPVTLGFHFVYSDGDTGMKRMCTGDILDAIFDKCGSYVATTTVYGNNGNTFDEARCCFDPDPLNYGAYIVWRQTVSDAWKPGHEDATGSDATIDLVQVNTSTGALWGTGVISHSAPANDTVISQPALCATTSWVYAVWDDDRGSGQQIYSSPWTNTGATIGTLSSVHGTKLSTWGTQNQAAHPDVIVNPDLSNTATVAWDEDDGGSYNPRWIRLNNSLIKSVGGNLKNASTAFTTPHAAVTLPDYPAGTPSVMTDARWSNYGYMQRNPKLAAVESDSEAFPYDITGTYPNVAHWILCTFECEAFNVYGGANANIWSDEDSSGYGHTFGYMQNNIVAQAINPNLVAGANPTQPLKGGELCLADATNAQDLCGLAYTIERGPVATIVDYENSLQKNGAVTTNIVRPYATVPPGTDLLSGIWNLPSDDEAIGAAPLTNGSYMPMVIHPAVGSPTAGVPAGPPYTWSVDAAYQPSIIPTGNGTVGVVGTGGVSYTSPGFTNILRLSGHIENIAGQWPLSEPLSWSVWGNGSQGVGFKRAMGSSASSDGDLSVSLRDNPANASTSALVSGIVGRTASIRLLSILGSVIENVGNISLKADGTSVPLDISGLPSGNYIVEAIGDEGSHASIMLTINH